MKSHEFFKIPYFLGYPWHNSQLNPPFFLLKKIICIDFGLTLIKKMCSEYIFPNFYSFCAGVSRIFGKYNQIHLDGNNNNQ